MLDKLYESLLGWAGDNAWIAYPTSTLHMPELAQVTVNAAHPR